MLVLCGSKLRSRSLMDRMLACEAGDPGSIPGESTIEKLP